VSHGRARGWVLFIALAAYLNSLANGFAYDDNSVVLRNPVVTEGRWGDALLGPYWTEAGGEGTLYRPVTIATLTAEWRLWGESPVGYHVVNVLLHALASVLVLALLARFVSLPAALAGAVVFAVHPVHVEAVANVVGLSELLAAAAVLGACLVYLGPDAPGPMSAGRSALRLGALSVLYLVGLGAKEIAVTLPGLLLLLELCRADRDRSLVERLRREMPVFLSLAAVLAAYLLLRTSVLGTLTGEVPAPALRGLSGGERVLTALTAWPEYLRLMVFPRTLSADYAPGVMMAARTVTPTVILGAGLLVVCVGGAFAAYRRAPMLSGGLGWFAIAVLPVSNLLFPAGILLAERTLYLPSVGLALVVAGVAEAVRRAVPARRLRAFAVAGGVAATALLVRTVARNPAWMSTYVVLNTLAAEHPESFLALRGRASGLARVGQVEQAARWFDLAVRLAPQHYGLLTEVAGFYARGRQDDRAEELLRKAIDVAPDRPTAYRLLAEMRIRQGRGREGHRIALEGLARAGPDRELWALVSESYIAKGDLAAAVRARRAALGQDSTSVHDWERLGELLAALGREEAADSARARARTLGGVPPRKRPAAGKGGAA